MTKTDLAWVQPWYGCVIFCTALQNPNKDTEIVLSLLATRVVRQISYETAAFC